MGLIFKKSTAQPAFTVAAAITGTAQVGQTLTCAYTVTKARANNVTVRWYSYFDDVGTDQVLIGTGTTYVLTGNEFNRFIRAIVTATNPAGAVQSTSSYTAAVTVSAPPDPPTIVTAAAITGTLEIGQTATVTYDFDGETSVAIQWFKYTSAGGGGATALGTDSTQSLSVLQDGNYIGCEVTATNAAGSTKSTAPILGPVVSAASDVPTIVSAASVQLDDGAVGFNEGEYLICDFECSGHTTTPTFVWYKCDAGRANPVELTGAGETVIRPLFKSEPNQYRGAIFLDQSLNLNADGKYIYCVATATNGFGSNPSTSNLVGPIGAIQGTPISQTTVGSGADPYYLNSAGTTYYLTEDVTFDGSGFGVIADNVTLNLNGKTLTFNDAASVNLANGSFESEATGWDFTNAGGSFETPNTTYTTFLTTDSEQRAYNTKRANSGVKSLRFEQPACADDGVTRYVESGQFTVGTGPGQLIDGKWYAVSCVMQASGSNWPTHFLRVAKNGSTLVTWSNAGSTVFNRGTRYGEVMFKAIAGNTYTIRLGVTGKAGSTVTVWYDDVYIARGRCQAVRQGVGQDAGYTGGVNFLTAEAGVTCGATTSSFTRPTVPDMVTGGSANRVKIKNGSITQGQDAGQWGSCCVGNVDVHRVTMTLSGPTGSCVRSQNWGAVVKVMDCTLYANHKQSAYRESWYGAPIWFVDGVIARNTILNACSAGIYAGVYGARYGATVHIYGNTVRNKSRYTNTFSILMRDCKTTCQVHDNIVDNTGDYYGRGCGVNAGNGAVVYNNEFSAQPSPWNTEYGPYIAQGDYALQVEGISGGYTVDVYGNTITASADLPMLAYDSNYPAAIAFRPKDLYASNPCYFHNNTVIAAAGQSGLASAYGLAKNGIGSLFIYDNTVRTNSCLVHIAQSLDCVLRRDSIQWQSPAAPKQWPIVSDYAASSFTLANPHFAVTMLDAVLDAEAETLLEAERPRSYTNGANTGAWTAAGNFYIAWTITVSTGQPGASVSITDKNATEVASGVANAAGVFVAEIRQQTSNTTGITAHSPYTAIATFDALSGSAQFTADAAKTVVVSMS